MDLQISRLDNLPPSNQEASHNKLVIDYNKIKKTNYFRHLCNNVCGKEVSLLCFVQFDVEKKNDIKKNRLQRVHSI